MIIENIETEKGNFFIDRLKQEGWKLKSQYSPFAFDKGIDYDCYELVLGKKTIVLEWNNWFEWTLFGSEEVVCDLQVRFFLSK
ncbi:hypothetical protein B6N13_08705 [Marinomonas sp. UCMA 3892]|jgi:hypothetical protein|uniref:hypothetical protein n=1 Tax=unclassified Marinomonas TaxID=196814 RepID=UPI00146CE981|nr:hypothetical protein [Marinomonas sp. UCMA 3892]NLU98181.1 hypothetical protein [Marinomonas sp. UCMA 3892]